MREFESKITEVWYRIRNSETPLAVFTIGTEVLTMKSVGARFEKTLKSPTHQFIGVYNRFCARDDLSCDISMVIDEIPDPDECILKTKTFSTK